MLQRIDDVEQIVKGKIPVRRTWLRPRRRGLRWRQAGVVVAELAGSSWVTGYPSKPLASKNSALCWIFMTPCQPGRQILPRRDR